MVHLKDIRSIPILDFGFACVSIFGFELNKCGPEICDAHAITKSFVCIIQVDEGFHDRKNIYLYTVYRVCCTLYRVTVLGTGNGMGEIYVKYIFQSHGCDRLILYNYTAINTMVFVSVFRLSKYHTNAFDPCSVNDIGG